ncbi:MAG: hypothetical protein ABIA12_03025 [Candidatus Aenigmatarchaeota archaeon]
MSDLKEKVAGRLASLRAFLHSAEFAKRVESTFLASNTVIASVVALASYIFIFGPGAHPTAETFVMFVGFSAVCFVAMDLIGRYANEPDKFNIRSLRLSMLALIVSLLIVRSVGVPQVFVFGMISLLLMSPLVYVVRTKWKISGHLYAFTAVTTVMSIVSAWFTPLYLLIPLISWSRLKLKAHTAGQVIAGAVIGFAVPVTIAILMNLVPVVA